MKKLLLNAFLLIIVTVLNHSNAAAGVYNMCSTTSITDSTGTLYDTGGPSDVYQINEACTLLIAPSCATSITLTFQSFATESGYDFFNVYDGQTAAAPNVLSVSGNILPSPVTCTSGYMLIIWNSDFIITDSGYACTWTSVIAPSIAPTAAFAIGTANPPLSVPVQFTDQSVGGTTGWLWDFGDGDTARSQNPTHAYATSGTFTVTLIAFQCSESDTITHTITVQAAPQIDVSPAAGFSASVACGDSASFNMNVANIGSGQLVYNTNGSSVGALRVLAMSYGADPFEEFPRTLSALSQYGSNYTITTTGTINPGVLSGLLVGVNVLLIAEQETGSPAVWSTLAPVIQQYLNNGGSVIFCGSYSSNADCMFNTGVFSGTFASNVAGLSVNILLPNDSLAVGLTGTSFVAPDASYSMNITNSDKVTVVDYQGDDVVTYRFFGSGKAIFVAFDYYSVITNPNSGIILANAVRWGGQNALPQWIHLSTTGDTVNGGDTSHVTVTFVASGVPAGIYFANIGVGSNDPNNPIVLVPCTLTVSGFPIVAISDTCINFGQVMQHLTATDTFTVFNTGCDTLFITSIQSTNTSAFTVGVYPSYLLPGAFANVVVTVQDTTVELASGSINILNNATNKSICLSANISPAPRATPSSNNITQAIRACGDSAIFTFTLTNTGDSGAVPLNWHLNSLPVWVNASPTTGSLAPDSSQVITLRFGSDTLVGGNKITYIVIVSNDPVHGNVSIPCTLAVDFNPCVSYTFISSTCTGCTDFTSSSINVPTNYHWDFGDGTTDTTANPHHCYPNNGTFTSVLIAGNASGTDTVTQVINAVITGPRACNCYPQTQAYCCGIGITLFQVTDPFGFKFNKSSPDAVDNYKDYTCTDNASLVTNFPYSINATTGFTYPEKFKLWLDMNNDGVLDSATEQLFTFDTLTFQAGTFMIPALPTNDYSHPLRLRIASDYDGNPPFGPCTNLQFGQVEDYSVFLSFYNGVNDVVRETGFSVYPNPFGPFANIEYNLKNSSQVTVEVFNIVGEKVSSFATTEMQSTGKHSYKFGGQPSGVYFVKLTVDGKSSTQKIIKM